MKKRLKKRSGFIQPLLAETGFTLIEILLGFLIFSIILVVLYSTFFSGIKIEERSVGDAAAYHQAKMSFDMIGHELEEAVPFDFSNFSPELTAFIGTGDSISFLTPGKSGLRHVSYYLKEKRSIKIQQTLIGGRYQKNVEVTNITGESIPVFCLVRSEEAFADFVMGDEDLGLKEEILFDNVQADSFKISYAHLKSEGDNPYLVWQDRWENLYIPAGVRFELQLAAFKKNDPSINIKKDVYIPTGFWGEAE